MSALVLACVAYAAAHGAPASPAGQVCAIIARMAPEVGLDPWQVAAMAWHESRFDPGAVSRTGCLGVLQVNPRYVPYSAQELATVEGGIEGGIYAAQWWQGRKGERWMHCYASGNRCSAGAYVRQVEQTRRALRGVRRRER